MREASRESPTELSIIQATPGSTSATRGRYFELVREWDFWPPCLLRSAHYEEPGTLARSHHLRSRSRVHL
jgi:hypothetical protein